MINITHIKNYCQAYQNIENYTEAVKSPLRYDLHHRREISENKSRKDLIDENLYYGRPPEELIFLSHGEHVRLHNAGKQLSTETRQKLSAAQKGEKSYMYGKNLSAETRQKISEAQKGNQNTLGHHWNMSAETRQKMSEAHKGHLVSEETKQKMSDAGKGHKGYLSGRHWHLENGKRIYTD